MQNPRHFYFKYVKGLKPEETGAMVRGSRIHEAFERFYEAEAARGDQVFDDPGQHLAEDRQLWADFLEPYVTNFIAWEHERWRHAVEGGERWLPAAIEEEVWRDGLFGEAAPAAMGLADVVLPAASLEEVPAETGNVVVDFKTGSTPRPEYRSGGIFTELEYYVMLFEDEYDITGAAAYYPRQDELLVSPEDSARFRDDIRDAVSEMVDAVASGDEKNFPTNPGPLCGWSPDDGCRSDYYGICSNCTWNVPVDNRERFEKLCERELDPYSIAFKLGCRAEEVRYWKSKLNL
jgi:RecB family exonuclease